MLVKDGTIVPKPEKNPPTVPMDYSWAQVSEKRNKTSLSLRFALRAVTDFCYGLYIRQNPRTFFCEAPLSLIAQYL